MTHIGYHVPVLYFICYCEVRTCQITSTLILFVKMEQVFCVDHPGEQVRFVCVPCSLKICRDCKMAEHEGHPTRDIGKTADQARRDLSVINSQLQTGIHIVQSQLRDAEANLKQFDGSVREANLELRGRAEALVKWAEKYREETMAALLKVADEGRKEQEELVNSLKHKIKKLNHFKHKINEALQAESDVKAIDTDIDLKEHGPGESLSCTNLLRNALKYRLQVAFTYSAEFDRHEQDIKRFLGEPVRVQVGKESPTLAVLTEFNCSKDPGMSVSAIQPLEEGKVCVVCSDEDRDEHFIAVYDTEKKTCLMKEIVSSDYKTAKIAQPTTTPLSLYPTVSIRSTVPMTINLDKNSGKISEYEDEPRGNTTLIVLKKSRRGYDVCDEMATPEQSWRAPFQINVDDPVTLCADAYGQYFAVIQDQREVRPITRNPSTTGGTSATRFPRPSVAIFRRQTTDRLALFQPNVRGFRPSDICFHTVDGREVLLVADEANNVIYIVDFSSEHVHDGRVEKRGELGAGCPWLTAPTAMAVDSRGVLWIGCRDGLLLSCVPTESLRTCHQPEVTDDETEYNIPECVDESSAGTSCSDVSTSGGTTASDNDVTSRSVSSASDTQVPQNGESVPRNTGLPVQNEADTSVEKNSGPDCLVIRQGISGESNIRQQRDMSSLVSRAYVDAVLPGDANRVRPSPQPGPKVEPRDVNETKSSTDTPLVPVGNRKPVFRPPPPIPDQGDSIEMPPVPPRPPKFKGTAPETKPEQPTYSNFELQNAALSSQPTPETEVVRPPPRTEKRPSVRSPAIPIPNKDAELHQKLRARLKKINSLDDSSATQDTPASPGVTSAASTPQCAPEQKQSPAHGAPPKPPEARVAPMPKPKP